MSHGPSLGLHVRIPEPTPGIGTDGKESKTGVGGKARGSQSPCSVTGTRGVGLPLSMLPCPLARSVVEDTCGEMWGARAPWGRLGLRPGVQHEGGWSGGAGAWGGEAWLCH